MNNLDKSGDKCDCPGGDKTDPRLHAPNCPVRNAPSRAAMANELERLAEQWKNEADATLPEVSEEDLCRSPYIEALTPTDDEWQDCETVQDQYDLMKRKLRAALESYRARLAARVEKGVQS